MSWDWQALAHHDADRDGADALDLDAFVARPAPGKVVRTGARRGHRQPSRSTPATAAVQADGGAFLVADDPFAIHLAARRGVSGSGAPLPHADAIQRAFGHHDVGAIRAHVGGAAAVAAAAIGARAYATGDDVAFASAPDLRQAAHEAAHVVQQRGGVALPGGVGAAGDRHERHADEVAAAVVRGDSAQALLDAVASPAAPSVAAAAAVQREEWEPSAEGAIRTLREGTGLTLDGSAITPTGDRNVFNLRHGGYRYQIRISGSYCGLMYGGDAAASERAFDEELAAPGVYDEGQLVVARALRPHIRSEGAVDSINTWDNQEITLAGRGSTEALELVDRAARIAAARSIACGDLAGRGHTLTHELLPGTPELRFSFTRIEELIPILAASRRAMIAAKIEDGMLRFYEGSSGARRGIGDIAAADRRAVADANAAGDLDEVVITIATHLNIGGHTRFPQPLQTAQEAARRYPIDHTLRPRDFANLSRQVAYLIKVRAEYWHDDDPVVSEYPGIWMYQKTRDFNNYFQNALTEADWGDSLPNDTEGHAVPAARGRERRPERIHNFFDIAAAHEVIPCWTALASLTGQADEPTGHVWLQVGEDSSRDTRHRGRYYDFGPPVLGAAATTAP